MPDRDRADLNRALALASNLYVRGRLSQQQWRAFRLRLAGRTWEAIGLVLGCSASSARVHYRRAEEKIKAAAEGGPT